MEQLNIHNYEAFYLDFLEGNLNKEESAQLFRFLDENPSLKIEEENFDEIINFNEQLDDSFKNELKQVDFELDEVTQMTINSFLIAQFEHQLSANKENAVETFLVKQPTYKVAQQQIKSTFLLPDLSINYPDKKGLKKSENRYLWPLISSIAAILVILFLVMNPTSIPSEGLQKALVVPKKDSRKTQPLILSNEMNTTIHKVRKGIVKSTNTISNLLQPEKEIQLVAQIDTISTKQEVIENELIAIQNEIEDKDQNIAEVSDIPFIKKRTVSNAAFDCVSALDKYPIESFTNNLSTIIKKQVEFKTCRNTKTNKAGFYLKIGKFIISKQTT
jgi:hypothetical protein